VNTISDLEAVGVAFISYKDALDFSDTHLPASEWTGRAIFISGISTPDPRSLWEDLFRPWKGRAGGLSFRVGNGGILLLLEGTNCYCFVKRSRSGGFCCCLTSRSGRVMLVVTVFISQQWAAGLTGNRKLAACFIATDKRKRTETAQLHQSAPQAPN